MQRRGIGMLLIAAALAAPARAQKAPETGYAFPAGGRAGSTVELRLGGYDWTPDTEVFLHDRRVKLEPVGPLGPILVTPPPYWFGPKSYSSPAPQPRELPVRVVLPADLPPGLFRWQVANANGASETGVFQVGSLPEVVEQEGRRAAQTLSELPLTVSGRLGRIEEVDRFRFTARRSGRVQCDAWSRRLGADVHLVLQIRDAQGRLVAETADTEGRDPTLDFAVSQGESYELAVHDLDFRGDWAYVYRLHLTETPAESASAAGGAPVEGGLPGTTQGVLAQGRAAHRFPWTGRKGEIWRLQVASRSLGARWDTSLQVLGPDGKELARNEDLPGTSDSGLEVALPADGIYTAVVSGAAARSVGPGAFRLTVRPAAPDFSLRLPQSLNVPSGGKADLKFAVQRTGGFRGPIRIRFEELPAGFRAPAAITVPEGANQLSVPIELPAATAVTAALVRAVGTATVDDQEVVRAAVVEASGPLTTRTPEERETDRFLIAGTMKPPFRVRQPSREEGRRVPRGAEFPAEIVVERDPGFSGPVMLQMSAGQDRHRQGIRGPDFLVPGDVSLAQYPAYWPEWLETSRTSRLILIGVAEVPDPTGRKRRLVVPLDGRITVWIEGALLKVECGAREPAMAPGAELSLPLKLACAPRLKEPIRIELQPPDELRGRVECAPVIVEPAAGAASLRLRLSTDPGTAGDHEFTVLATTRVEGKWRVEARTVVPIRLPGGSGAAIRASPR